MSKLLISIILSIFIIPLSFSQQTIKGVVTNSNNGEKIDNVKITVKGDSTTAYTDKDGEYKITIPSGFKTLLFSAHDMQVAEINVSGNIVDVAMQYTNVDIFELTLEELLSLEVTIASRQKEKITEAPANIIVITQYEIETYGWRDLKDIFKAIPQVDVSYNTEGEVGTIVTMRGLLGNQKILILQDGMQVNPITGERFVYSHNIPLSLYKRIEILYGPAAALYGADAYAGVINLISKDGKDVDGLEINTGYISTNAVIADITFGKAISKDADILIFGRIYNGQDQKLNQFYKDSIDYGMLNNYNSTVHPEFPIKNWNFFTKVNVKNFTFGVDWQHCFESNAYSTIPVVYSFTDDFIWGQDISHAYANYKIIDNDKFNLTANIVGGRYEVNPASNFLYFTNGHQNTEIIHEYKYAYSAYVKTSLLAFWDINKNISFTTGLSYAYVKSFPKTKNLEEVQFDKSDGFVDDLSYFVDSTGYVYGSTELTDSIFGLRNYQNFGSFVQIKIQLLEKIIFTLGSRFDYNTIFESTFNPRLGLVANPNDKISIKALFGTAYIQPSNYYRYENWASVVGMHIPNIDIKPEQLKSYELSFNYLITKNLSFKILGFRNEMTNIIRAIVVTPETYNGGHQYYNPLRTLIGEDEHTGFVEVNDNLGSMYSQGLEFDLNTMINKFQIKLSYSYLEGEDSESDFPLEKISNHKILGNIAYLQKYFSIAFTVRYFSDISTSIYNSVYGLNGVQYGGKIPGGFVMFANININLTENISLNISADNIFNTKHYGAAPFAESGWIMARAPQPMFQIFGGISIKI
jgi:iron complex outermembrane receptor protein